MTDNQEGARQVGLRKAKDSKLSTEMSKPSWTPSEKSAMAQCLMKVSALQRSYGKTSAELEILVDGFAWVLQGYAVHDVIHAIGVYIQNHPDIPTPYDIRCILSPEKPIFRPDWEVYKSLKKLKIDHGAFALCKDEEDYLKACERFSLNNRRDSSY